LQFKNGQYICILKYLALEVSKWEH